MCKGKPQQSVEFKGVILKEAVKGLMQACLNGDLEHINGPVVIKILGEQETEDGQKKS